MNVIIRKITDCNFRVESKGYRKSGAEKTNGYFLVGEERKPGSWGTCFLRIISSRSKKPQDQIDITYNTDPSFFHTYTKIPQSIAHNVFHVYVNYEQGSSICLDLPQGARVIGFDTPQPSGSYLNRSFLIYSPSGVEPTIETTSFGSVNETFFIRTGEEREMSTFSREDMFKGRVIQKLFLSEEGYVRRFFETA